MELLIEKILESEPKKKLDDDEIQFFKTYIWKSDLRSGKMMIQMVLELAFGEYNDIYFEGDSKEFFVLTKNKKPLIFITPESSLNAEGSVGENFNLISLLEENHPEIQYFWGLAATYYRWTFTCYFPKENLEIEKFIVSEPRDFCLADDLDEEMLSEIIQILRFIYKTDPTRSFHDVFNAFGL